MGVGRVITVWFYGGVDLSNELFCLEKITLYTCSFFTKACTKFLEGKGIVVRIIKNENKKESALWFTGSKCWKFAQQLELWGDFLTPFGRQEPICNIVKNKFLFTELFPVSWTPTFPKPWPCLVFVNTLTLPGSFRLSLIPWWPHDFVFEISFLYFHIFLLSFFCEATHIFTP